MHGTTKALAPPSNTAYELLGVTGVWRWSKERMEHGPTRKGWMCYRALGVFPATSDVRMKCGVHQWEPSGTKKRLIQATSGERVGFSTQESLALLDSII